MADYDVSAAGLASPPALAPRASYTPAILVRNNGIHARAASGSLSCYDKVTGVLLATWPVASPVILPGATGSASAAGALDLSAQPVGKTYMFTGYVTCDRDQVPGNNPLPPTFVTVADTPPPPPPPVEPHRDQHQEGGADELALDGLRGVLADAQTPATHADSHGPGGVDELAPAAPLAHADSHHPTGEDPLSGVPPLAHASSHEPGGSDEITAIEPGPHAATHSPEGGDEIDVTGLPGLLADPQTPALHVLTHAVGGADVLDVTNLTGELAYPQTPKLHADTHAPEGSDPLAGLPFEPHAARHQVEGDDVLDVTNLRGLLADAQLPSPHHTDHEHGQTDVIDVTGLNGELADPQPPKAHDNAAHSEAYTTAAEVNAYTAERIGLHDEALSAHGNAENLEQTPRRGQADGYCDLDENALVPTARLPGFPTPGQTPRWLPALLPSQGATPVYLRADSQPCFPGIIARAGRYPDPFIGTLIAADLTIPAGQMPAEFTVRIKAWGHKSGFAVAGGEFGANIFVKSGGWPAAHLLSVLKRVSWLMEDGSWLIEASATFMTDGHIYGFGRIEMAADNDDFYQHTHRQTQALQVVRDWSVYVPLQIFASVSYEFDHQDDRWWLDGATVELLHQTQLSYSPD